MIFVTVGNARQPFDRLLRRVDALCESGEINEETLIQRGHSAYAPVCARYVDFLPGAEFQQAVKGARVVIAHAGVGTILHCLRNGRLPVLVPRLKSEGEVVDDHQLQICEVMAEQGRAVYVEDLDQLAAAIRAVENHAGAIPGPATRLHNELAAYLRDLVMSRTEPLSNLPIGRGRR